MQTQLQQLVSALIEYGTPLEIAVALSAEFKKEENWTMAKMQMSVAEKYAKEFGVEERLRMLKERYNLPENF